jgi:glycerophosphoryl diester phosphodiesterase
MAAMVAAMAVPDCDGVELDVRASFDGVPVVLHDETLARVFGRPEACRLLTASELGAIGVPTLAQILEVVRPPAFVDVELKEDVAAAAIAVIEAARGDPPAGVALSSFDPAILVACQAVASDWPRWLNADELDATVLTTAIGLGCAGVSVRWRALDRDRVANARRSSLLVAAWTVTIATDLARLIELGVDAICLEGEAL